MSAFCTPPAMRGMAARLLADIDCQAFGLVERGYAALSQPGGAVSAALTAMLVLSVAFFGYRLLLGYGLNLADAVGLAIRIGIVLLIATSWASWQPLAYDTLARAPTQIAAEMLNGIGAPRPLAALQYTLDSLEAANAALRARAGVASPLIGGPGAAAMTLNLSAQTLILSTVGLLVVARVVLALLLALAPVMAGFLLFDATRGMAEGWLRAMVTAALAPIFVLVVSAIELSILQPLIARVLAEQAGGRFEATTATPVGLVTLTFALAIVAGIAAGARIASGIRLPRRRDAARSADAAPARQADPVPVVQLTPQRIVQALEGMGRRDRSAGRAPAQRMADAIGRQASAPAGVPLIGNDTGARVREWQPTDRRAPPRRSRAAMRRDG